MGRKYSKFVKNVNITLGQCGTMKEHFSNALKDLEKLKSNLDKKQFLKKAKKDLKRANYTGLRLTKFYGKVNKTITKVMNDEQVSKEDKNKLTTFKRLMVPHDALLTRETSYFRGRLDGDVKKFEVIFDLFNQKKQTSQYTIKVLNNLIRAIKNIIAESGNQVGLMPFMAGLRDNLLPVAEKIQGLRLKKSSGSVFRLLFKEKDVQKIKVSRLEK